MKEVLIVLLMAHAYHRLECTLQQQEQTAVHLCSGVAPSSSCAFTSAPFSSSSRTMLGRPLLACRRHTKVHECNASSLWRVNFGAGHPRSKQQSPGQLAAAGQHANTCSEEFTGRTIRWGGAFTAQVRLEAVACILQAQVFRHRYLAHSP